MKIFYFLPRHLWNYTLCFLSVKIFENNWLLGNFTNLTRMMDSQQKLCH